MIPWPRKTKERLRDHELWEWMRSEASHKGNRLVSVELCRLYRQMEASWHGRVD